jgi:hypothetical protein
VMAAPAPAVCELLWMLMNPAFDRPSTGRRL